jgi:hypothetical protein
MDETTLEAPPKPMLDKIRIRAMQPSDFNYVINSWLKTFKYTGPSVQRIRDYEYYQSYEPIVKSLIKRSDVFIACLREEPEIIIGYLAIERQQDLDLIHFVQVKNLWQNIGIGRYLLQAAHPQLITYFTHWTNPVDSLVNKFNFTYNPYLIFKEPNHG